MRDQLRAALWLSSMPAVLGAFMLAGGQVGGAGPLGIVGPAVALAAAWLAFMVAALVPALVVRAIGGEGSALRTRATCPSCGASVPIIVFHCTHCGQSIGLPASSKITYAITMTAWGAFLVVLYLRPDRALG